MAQILLMKIGTDGLLEEMASGTDDVTLASYTVTGGGPVLTANLDMNNGNVSDINDIAFTDPTTDGITVTDGTHAADSILMEDSSNVMTTAGGINFPIISDAVGEVDAFRLPALAGAPTATPTSGGEGHLVWDSTNDTMYAWTGSAWDDLGTVNQANRVCNSYTASEILALGDIVYISAADTVSKADAAGNYEAIGMARTAIGAAGSVDICSDGVLTGMTGLTAGSRYFLSATAGAVTTTAPTGSGSRVVQVGYAKSTTAMHMQFAVVGRRA